MSHREMIAIISTNSCLQHGIVATRQVFVSRMSAALVVLIAGLILSTACFTATTEMQYSYQHNRLRIYIYVCLYRLVLFIAVMCWLASFVLGYMSRPFGHRCYIYAASQQRALVFFCFVVLCFVSFCFVPLVLVSIFDRLVRFCMVLFGSVWFSICSAWFG